MSFYSAACAARTEIYVSNTNFTEVETAAFLVQADTAEIAETTAQNRAVEIFPDADEHYVAVELITNETLQYITEQIGQ